MLFGGVLVAHIFNFLCCVFCILSLFCVFCPILHVSLDYWFLIDRSVFSKVYLLSTVCHSSISYLRYLCSFTLVVSSTYCVVFLFCLSLSCVLCIVVSSTYCVVFLFCFVFLRLVFYLPNVASFFWIVHFLCVYLAI